MASSCAAPARALHYVLKIGDRRANIAFFCNVLGMTVLRHEEFREGCEALCNGPYAGRWSKTMIGYGNEDEHFVLELTYNYGKKTYVRGNDLRGIIIATSGKHYRQILSITSGTVEVLGKDYALLTTSPDGYPFYVINTEATTTTTDGVVPVVTSVALNVSSVRRAVDFYHVVCGLPIVEVAAGRAVLGSQSTKLDLTEINATTPTPLCRAEAYGRMAFSIPYDCQPVLEERAKVSADEGLGRIQKPLVTLDTPGKASVRVLILCDGDGHENCFVEDEGFRKLSAVDPQATELLESQVKKDKS